MSLLLKLSPELLLQVMEHLGSSFFHSDLRRLTICKYWYYLACKVFWGDIKFSAQKLDRFILSPNVTTQLERFGYNLKSLTLELFGIEEWDEALEPYEGLDSDPRGSIRLDLASYRKLLFKWTNIVNTNICQLVGFMQNCNSLRELRFTAFSEEYPLIPMLPRRDYLFANTLSRVLSLKNLTVLEIDSCGSGFLSGDNSHICASIRSVLPQLHRLRLRLCEICPVALRCLNESTSLRLKDVVVNLSLQHEPSVKTSGTHAKRCNSTIGEFMELKSDMEGQLHVLLGQMSCPRKVRLLYQFLPDLDLRSLDVITGKVMTLTDDMAWEDDGQTKCEDPEESEV